VPAGNYSTDSKWNLFTVTLASFI